MQIDMRKEKLREKYAEPVPVLDHGYVELVETWGSDEQVIRSARMSTDKGFLGWGPGGNDAERVQRFSDTVGALSGGNDHADRCTCQRKEVGPNAGTPHKHYDAAPHPCARCGCSAYVAELPSAGDEKLLRFLWEKKHSTPFEFGGLTIETQAPLIVFREWHRHRVPFGYCLTGDAEITCIGSGGLTRHYTIEHIYHMKHEGVVDQLPQYERFQPGRTKNGYSKSGTPVTRTQRLTENYATKRVRLLPSCQTRMLRVLDESTEMYTTAAMSEVWQSGVKEILRVETPNGKHLKTSADHLFYTREGWKRMGDLRAGDRLATNGLVARMERPYPPALRSGIGVWTSMMRSRLIRDEDRCYICGQTFPFDELELDHVVPVVLDLRQALDESNLKPACRTCHRAKTTREQPHRSGQTGLGVRWVEITKRPERVGEEMTYDIAVDGPHKNFVANGLVVHNSELSARYTPMPDLHYRPTVDRIVKGAAAAGGNRQARAASDVVIDDEHAVAWLAMLDELYLQSQRVYDAGLAAGVPKEVARLAVTVARYSRMQATGNLRGWLAFLALRTAKDAQWEIRMYALVVADILRGAFPRTMELFDAGRKPSVIS